jgi:HSP20 family protein
MAIIRREPNDLPQFPGTGVGNTFSDMLDRVFEDFTRSTGLTRFQPSVDILEQNGEYEIDVNAPGMKKDDFDVSVNENTLRIQGERSWEEEDNKKNYHLKESGYGKFERSFRLPNDVDPDQIKAEYENGVLKLHLPKSEEQQSQKRIEIS